MRIIVGILVFFFVQHSLCQVPPEQISALQDFYSSTNPEVWDSNQTWDFGNTDPCNVAVRWVGIKCTSGKITTLDLRSRELIGSLSASLGALNDLTSLNLFDNQLTGSLPPEWSTGFSSLQYCVISGNQFTGILPSAWRTGFSSLKTLSLYGNQLTGSLPPEWSTGFSSLQGMYIYDNQLTGSLPPEWSTGFSSLQYLDLHGNQLTGSLPSAWSILSLRILEIYTNQLTGTLPPEWGTGFPILQYLDLKDNLLIGSLPPQWNTGFPSLNSMLIYNNQLTGSLPPEWSTGFSSLQYLYLQDNQLTGTLPPEWGSGLSRLAFVTLQDNQLTGTFPSEWSTGLPSLQSLSLSSNRLCGTLPSTKPATVFNSTGNYFRCPNPSWCATGVACGNCYNEDLGSCSAQDDCLGAVSLTSGVVVSGNNLIANSDTSRISTSCGGISANQNNGIWFSFNSGSNDVVSLSLCGGATFDTVLQLFSGSCSASSLDCIAANDDGCGTQSEILNVMIPQFKTYYVLVSGASSAESGPFNLTMTLSLSSGGGGDPHIQDSCGHLFDTPKSFAGHIMQLYHDDRLHINALIDDRYGLFTEIGVSFVHPESEQQFIRSQLECRLDEGFPGCYFNGTRLNNYSGGDENDLPGWIHISEPSHQVGFGVLSEFGRYHVIELEVDSMFIIVGGYHPQSLGFFNVLVLQHQHHQSPGLLQCQNQERSSPVDFQQFVRSSLFE